jgi:hypothetical protein
MTSAVWGGASVALDLISFIPFIWAALSGQARPSRISWSMWAGEYWVLFVSEFTYGSGLASVWIAGGEAAGSTTLVAVGWLQYRARRTCPSTHPRRTRRPAGRDRWRRSDGHLDNDPPRWLTLAMIAGVATALAAWQLSTGFIAIILAVAVDMMAASVNAYKTYRHPAGESMLSWWLFLAATIAALLAVGRAAPILYAYPGVGALTAIAMITAWATGRPDLRSYRPAGSQTEPDTAPRAPTTPRASDHSKSMNRSAISQPGPAGYQNGQAAGLRTDTHVQH